ncbi:MAG: hypothetical protein ACLFUB_19100 [Cyclobacteriaceae bacterium]
MAQYVSFAKGVEVNGQTILSFVNALPIYKSNMLDILIKHGIKDLEADNWYPQQAWLDAFKEIGEKYGSNTLFAIGKAIPENAKFPPEIKGLENALSAIDMAYHMNHRKGEIGYYKLIEFNSKLRIALMECKNPYPSDFDKGIIATMSRRFKPNDAIVTNVELDRDKPSRLNGANSCTYKISW